MDATKQAVSETANGNGSGMFELATRAVRFLAVDAVEQARSGHPGAPMGLAGIGVDLFSRYLRYNPDDPQWPNRDRFILSCGHASALVYALLHLAGYDLCLDDLKQFRQWGSRTPGHPELGDTPGVETTTGPLGQGIGNAVGLALAGKMAAARLNTPSSRLVDYRVFVMASDGDMMEGVSSEVASLAGHLGLDNLIVIYDDNHVTIDGKTELTFSENVGQRFEAYGWSVAHVDGHDPIQVRSALDRALTTGGRPSLIVARTHIGFGAPTKQDRSSCHGAPLGPAEAEAAKRAAGWPLEPFFVPEGVRELFASHVERNCHDYRQWQQTLAALDDERARVWQQLSTRAVPPDILDRLLDDLRPRAAATRVLASESQQAAAALVPALVQGAADLAASTMTTIVGAADVGPGQFAGRNLHYGIREHAMGSIMTGLALSGWFIPVGSTFLVFSDYMRPAIRLAALMGQQVIYVFTHDSIFVGEDGPTHQPVEHLWVLRAIPNLDVFRPADAVEAAAAWAYALSRRGGPTALSLSRHTLPVLERGPDFDASQILKGAYVLADSPDPDLVLVATGSEVHTALEARRLLEAKGKRARVVSAPCWQAFERLPRAEQEAVLASPARRVTVEAGSSCGWRGVVGHDGLSIGLDRFGASAPASELAERFGFTGAHIAERILAEL
jgi:transketolase